MELSLTAEPRLGQEQADSTTDRWNGILPLKNDYEEIFESNMPFDGPTRQQIHELEEHIKSVYGPDAQVQINVMPKPTTPMSYQASHTDTTRVDIASTEERLPTNHRPTNRRRKLRPKKACRRCRERKTKCSGDEPSCNKCLETQSTCHYPELPTVKTTDDAAKVVLQRWVDDHSIAAYPSKKEKESLATETGLSIDQVSTFFRNARSRWSPPVEDWLLNPVEAAAPEAINDALNSTPLGMKILLSLF
ncbi:hypothetical protein BT63DRAFT_210748 [Microthyrium microscopicum]|uniref:Zn(2)-C6 fungal-type domain-containing protein n=1 Tax=Microthyrium microscopicum TaxID=703497 RepID=A0A6A6UHD6_9PEZI|nr:hypothetical protein BT63DRAFT_210748 [Microthyrium microscopicum]